MHCEFCYIASLGFHGILQHTRQKERKDKCSEDDKISNLQ